MADSSPVQSAGPTLTGLVATDSVDLWRQLKFVVADSRCEIGGVDVELTGPAAGSGLVGWSFDRPIGSLLAGVPTGIAAAPTPGPAHPNGVIGVDHVVLMASDLDDVRGELARAGIAIRRERTAESGGGPLRYLFARVGSTILEVVGPVEASGATDRADAPPARLWGLTLVSDDLDETVGTWTGVAGPIRPAIQPGRRIASLDTRHLGGSVRLAVMTPHERRAQPPVVGS